MNMRRGAWAAQRPLTGEQLPPSPACTGGPLAASQEVN